MTKFEDMLKVCEIEQSNYSYEFDLWAIFFDPAAQTFYVGQDSGCSCPMPWERVSTEDLEGPYTFVEVLRELDKMVLDHPNSDKGWFVDDAMDARDRLRTFAKEKDLFPNRF